MDSPPTSRRRPRPRTAEGGRRLHSAGSAIVVSLIGLGVALFLNAPGLHKSATIQPEGWKRNVALGVTGPLESVSSALLLDRPRRALKAALGRSGDDEIDTAVTAPQPKPPTPVVVPETPAERVTFTPKRKLGVWIAGDSLVVVPGESLLRQIAGNRAIAVDGIDGRIASGLERPDVFNWFTHVRDVMQEEKPRAVVLMFGGNDDHGFMTGIPQGKEVGTFGSPTWRAEYRRRVAGVMDTVTRDGAAYLVWIGLPISHDAEQTLRFDLINTIVETEAAKRPGRVSYLDTYFFFAGKNGGYAQYVEDSTGKLVKMRADDGVHFERAAGDLIAAKVLERLEQRYDFTSWRGR
jgi:hypothetical protein